MNTTQTFIGERVMNCFTSPSKTYPSPLPVTVSVFPGEDAVVIRSGNSFIPIEVGDIPAFCRYLRRAQKVAVEERAK